jgi:RimJ/RimL family protein N-acetyltransferase
VAWLLAPEDGLTDGAVLLRRFRESDAPQTADAERLLAAMSIQRIFRGRTGEIGYWTAPWARGRGVMTRAVRLLAGWSFDEFDLRRIEIIVAVDNTGSNRVAEKAGFTCEGVLRQYRENKGVWRDHYMWSLLRDEI